MNIITRLHKCLHGKNNIYHRTLLWREKHVQEKHFLLFVSFLVGICTAASAIVLKQMIHLVQSLLTGHMNISQANYLYLLYPILGILLAGLFVKYIVRDDISHGVTKVLYAISQRKSRIKTHNTYSSLVASSLTIGLGGSVGAEAPIVLTGAAIGSNLGRLFRLEHKTLMLLVGCGAAGAVAGIFKAPIAGLVFVIEVLMLDLTMTSVMPLLITSVTAATVAYIFNGTEAMFKFSQTESFLISRIPYVLILGILCGLLSLYVTRVMNRLEGILKKFPYHKKFIICALTLSLLIFLLPPLYGEGYDTIRILLNGQYAETMNRSLFYPFRDNIAGVLLFMLLILLSKVFASTVTNGGGGCGGVFAPSLYMGCILGFTFAHSSTLIDFIPNLSEKNFALLGMAGVMSGIMHAPLTGVFLIAELTGGYDLFLPLMIVSISSYLTILAFEPHSIYTMRLAQKGELLTHHKDRAVLTLLNLQSLIEKEFETLRPEQTLGDVVRAISRNRRNAFPVTDSDNRLIGVVQLDNIRNIMFRPELYDRFKVSKIMISVPARIDINMQMDRVMQTFDDTKAWNLPVVDADGRYLGFLSKSKIFNSYREILVDTLSTEYS
ncbi:MAG: chloride channel protein [Tannerellaceae bacterium]|jgi:CIC family chloride channel protein|nr:chloride channel protein [Tannerellaceae bacterium]